MSKKAQMDLLATAQTLAAEHDCPYASEILRSGEIQQLGTLGIAAAKLDLLLLDLGIIHNRNVCPPTHHGRGLTHEWMVWTGEVDDVENQAHKLGIAGA